MEESRYLELPDEAMRKIIRKDLGEDSKKLERQIELFKEWLRCEPYLLEDVDERLIRNFVSWCKCNLEKAKQKFESFLIARMKLKKFYSDRDITDSYFGKAVQRFCYVPPKLTPDGYRVALGILPEDANDFDFDKLFHYSLFLCTYFSASLSVTLGTMYSTKAKIPISYTSSKCPHMHDITYEKAKIYSVDFVLLEDECAGFIIVNDLKNMSPQILGKLNIKLVAHGAKLIYSSSPLRFKGLHLVNVPHVPEPLVALVKKVVPRKLIERVYAHKNVEDLKKNIPADLLPKEYAGSGTPWNELTDELKQYFINNKRMREKTSKLKLKGDLLQSKSELYSFEDCEMGGSFRQLSID